MVCRLIKTKYAMSLEVCTNESKKLYASHAPRNGCNVVKRLVNLFHGMGHVVVMDNFFTSMELFECLMSKGMYATCTIQSERRGIPKC